MTLTLFLQIFTNWRNNLFCFCSFELAGQWFDGKQRGSVWSTSWSLSTVSLTTNWRQLPPSFLLCSTAHPGPWDYLDDCQTALSCVTDPRVIMCCFFWTDTWCVWWRFFLRGLNPPPPLWVFPTITNTKLRRLELETLTTAGRLTTSHRRGGGAKKTKTTTVFLKSDFLDSTSSISEMWSLAKINDDFSSNVPVASKDLHNDHFSS